MPSQRKSRSEMRLKEVPRLTIGIEKATADIEYLLGADVPGPVIALEHRRKRHAVVSLLETGRLRRTSPDLEIWSPATLKLGRRQRRSLSSWAIALIQLLGIKKVMVDNTFPLDMARKLKRAGIGTVIAGHGLFPERAVKSEQEIRNIRQTQQAAVIAMRTAQAMIGESGIDSAGRLVRHGATLTSEALKSEIARILMEHQCICPDAIVACGPLSADPHEQGTGPLWAGQPVVIDIFPRHLGHHYWGDLTRTVVKGRPSTRLKKMYMAVRTAQQAALSRVKAGVKAATVHQAADMEFRKRGFRMSITAEKAEGFIHSTGHGVGLSVHEAPAIGSDDRRLRAGNVITIEPGLYYRDSGGIRIEDTILVTGTGWKYLVPCEKRFEL